MRHILCSVFASMLLVGCVNDETSLTTNSGLTVGQLRPSNAVGVAGLDGEVKNYETAVLSIRRSFVQNDLVPTRGKDVRLIVSDGVITLRGMVGSEHEKVSIHKLARQHVGSMRIENRLEIESSMDQVHEDAAAGSWLFQ